MYVFSTFRKKCCIPTSAWLADVDWAVRNNTQTDMGETEIDIAIKMFEENAQHADAKNEAYFYNLNSGLLAMARAIKELQETISSS